MIFMHTHARKAGMHSGTTGENSVLGLKSGSKMGCKKTLHFFVLAMVSGLFSGCSDLEKAFKEKKKPIKGRRFQLCSDRQNHQAIGLFSAEKIASVPVDVLTWGQPGLNSAHHMGALQLDGGVACPLKKVWEKKIGKNMMLPVAPIATSKHIFVVDHQGFLSAYDWAGKKVWSVQVNPHKDLFGMGGGLATDGQRVYVTTPHRWVLALDCTTGKRLWSYVLSHPARNGPSLSGNRLAILTLSNQTILLDAACGQEIWDHQGLREDTLILGSSVPAISQDRVIVGTASGELLALSLDQGERLWDQSLVSMGSADGEKNFRHIHAYPVVVESYVYATSHFGQLGCFDLYTGDVIWSQDFGGTQPPVVVGDVLFAITTAGQLMAIDRHTGKEFWRIFLGKNAWFGPVMAGGLLYTLSDKGSLVAFDPVRKKCMSYIQLGGSYTMAPIVIKGGLLVFSADGNLSFYKRASVNGTHSHGTHSNRDRNAVGIAKGA